MNYFPWIHDKDDDGLAWTIESPDNIAVKDYLLTEGISVRSWFPADVTFQLSDEHGIRLADSIPNVMNMLILSERLKDFLERNSGAQIEFFPVKIQNQKGRIEEAPYFLANVLGSISCVDAARSDFVQDALAKDQVDYFKRLVLDATKIPPDAKLFRLGEKRTLLLASEDFAESVVEADFTGMLFQYIEEYGTEFRD